MTYCFVIAHITGTYHIQGEHLEVAPHEKKLTSPNITITGWVSRAEALAKIMSSDIFLFPSAWESLSIARMEVMYVGKPCVVGTADGNRDVINTGKNGFVCSTKKEYVDAIQELLDKPELANKYVRRAHQDILDTYNVRVMEKKYRRLFTKLGV